MMKKRLQRSYYLYFLILAIALAACTRKAEKAAAYNDEIISFQTGITDALDNLDSLLRDTNSTEDRIKFYYATLQTRVKHSILALDSIGPFQKDPLLQLAARDLFREYDRMIDADYKILIDVKLMPAQEITPEIADTTYSAQQRIYQISSSAQSRFLIAQAEFGKKYHLEFE